MKKNKKCSILKSYLFHTFSRLQEENKIAFAPQNNFCSFNTGLLTKYDEFIYMLFKKNREKNKSEWFCEGICSESTHYLSKYCGSKLPEKADFFDDPAQLIYNTKKELRVNYQHIIEDNLTRFPDHLQSKDFTEIKNYLSGVIE